MDRNINEKAGYILRFPLENSPIRPTDGQCVLVIIVDEIEPNHLSVDALHLREISDTSTDDLTAEKVMLRLVVDVATLCDQEAEARYEPYVVDELEGVHSDDFLLYFKRDD